MAREIKRKKSNKVPLGRLLLILFVIWIGFHFGRNAWDNHKLQRQISALEKQIAVLELRGAELEREIEEWKSPANVERVAREELGLVKPGEVMYIISEPLTSEVDRDVKKR